MKLFTNIILSCICRTFLSCTNVRILHIYIWICFDSYKIGTMWLFKRVTWWQSIFVYFTNNNYWWCICSTWKLNIILNFNISIFNSLIYKNKAFTKQNTYRLVTDVYVKLSGHKMPVFAWQFKSKKHIFIFRIVVKNLSCLW